MKRAPKALSLLASVLLLACLVPGAALAQEADIAVGSAALEAQDGNIASGTWGTCPWVISDDGTLTVGAGIGGEQSDGSRSPWYAYRQVIKRIDFTGDDNAQTIAPINCQDLFRDLDKVRSIDFTGFNVANTTSMFELFRGCASVQILDLSSWDTSHVVDMKCMFDGCTSLTTLNNSNWVTSNVKSMSLMFLDCTSLTSLDLSGWDTAGVEDMSGMFQDCSKLTDLNLSNWDTSGAISMCGMFRLCPSLKSLNLSGWDVSGIAYMFENCYSLESLDLSNWDTTGITSVEGLFQNCSSLTTLNLSGWDTSKATNMHAAFQGCSSLTSLDLSGWDASKVTDMRFMLQGCSALELLNISGWDISNVTDAYRGSMFAGCVSLRQIVASGLKLPNSCKSLFSGLTALQEIKGAETWDTSSVTDMSELFKGCTSLKTIDLSSWNTTDVKSLVSIFYDCSSLKELNLSSWDVSKVPNMNFVFHGCSSLESLSLSNWNTSNVTSMTGTFANCRKLMSLDLSGWKTWNVANIDSMFFGCSSLKSLDLSSWSTLSLTHMQQVFIGCSSLEAVNLTGWDTSEVTDMRNLFSGCSSLESLNLSNWDVSAVTIMDDMFKNCSSLETLCISGWNSKKLTMASRMFYGCSSLKSLDISGLDISGITEANRNSMFTGCSSLEQIDAAGLKLPDNCKSLFSGLAALKAIRGAEAWNTTRVTDLTSVFSGCASLKSLDLSGWDTSNVTSLASMFADCSSLTVPGVSNWNTSKVQSMASMFSGCASLKSLDLSGWDTSNVTSLASMFADCSSLTVPGVSNWNTSKVQSMASMFSGCASLVTPSISSLDVSEVRDLESVFFDCSSIESLDLSSWETSNLCELAFAFSGCTSLKCLDLSGWDTSKVTSMQSTFSGCSSLESLDLSSWNISKVVSLQSVFAGCSLLCDLDLPGQGTSSATNLASAFSGCMSLKSLDLSNWDTSIVWSMQSTFSGCSSLESLDLSSWSTNYVYMTTDMFSQCNALRFLKMGSGYGIRSKDMFPKVLRHGRECLWRLQATGGLDSWEAVVNGRYCKDDVYEATLDIKEAEIVVPAQVFQMAPIEPKPKVVLDGETLQEGVDYVIVSYTDNTDSGSATITIQGIGDYSCAAMESFSIAPAPIYGASIGLTEFSFVYDGTPKKPDMTVMLNGGVLREGRDYEVGYSDNIEAGIATVVVTGRNNFAGSASISFAIAPAKLTAITLDQSEYVYTGEAQRPAVSMARAGLLEVSPSGYDVSYSDENPQAAGKYTAIVTGKGNYTGSATATFEIIHQDVSNASIKGLKRVQYTGKAIMPNPVVEVEGSVLAKGVDYELSYKDNVEAGIATVIITGKGNYTGSTSAMFEIESDSQPPGPDPTPTPDPDPAPTPDPTPGPDPAPAKPDLEQYEGVAAKSGMADLRAGEWFMDPKTGAFPGTNTLYIDYTIARGLMGGYKDDSGRVTAFGPHDPLSRAQTATILYRLANPDSEATTDPTHYEANKSGLTDVASGQYYTAAVNWCVHEGIITGYKDKSGRYTTFGPDDSVSREQLATMIFRYCTIYAKQPADTADITAFSDYAKISDWARAGVAYCVANKIVGGYTDGSGRFGPQDSAERCQMAKIIAVTARMAE